MAASIFQPLDKKSAGLAFVLGLATILGALGSQFIGGLQPCELCLEQRMSYYYGLPILLAVLITWNRLPLAVWYVAMAIVTAIFVWAPIWAPSMPASNGASGRAPPPAPASANPWTSIPLTT
jgi:disulfide bond formation protein DsbB